MGTLLDLCYDVVGGSEVIDSVCSVMVCDGGYFGSERKV